VIAIACLTLNRIKKVVALNLESIIYMMTFSSIFSINSLSHTHVRTQPYTQLIYSVHLHVCLNVIWLLAISLVGYKNITSTTVNILQFTFDSVSRLFIKLST